MTDIEKKALALVNELFRPLDDQYHTLDDAGFDEVCEALLHAIEQHEAFRQEVSDAVEGYAGMVGLDPKRYFARFILPKPDPLVEAIQAADEAHPGWESASDYAQHLRAALAARGLEVRKIGEGE